MQSYFCKTKIYAGDGAVSALQEMGCRRLFLICDPFFVQNGTADRIAGLSGAEKVELYSHVKPDPTVEQVAAGTAALKAFAPDGVAVLGGGSAIDLGKAMVYFSGLSLPFAVIPTTSGSGSEVTDFAILTHGGTKHPLIDESLCPDMAILDGELLKKLPPQLIADTGFDVLTHALEAYCAEGASAFTDGLAEKAFCTVFQNLAASYSGDTRVRLDIHMASTMAGMAFTRAGLGLCHALAHSLGGLYHVPHGRLNSVLLPAVIRVNSAVSGKKLAHVARLAGLPGATDSLAARNLEAALVRLRKGLQLPQNLCDCGISPHQLRQDREKIIESTLADPCCQSNPLPVDRKVVWGILEAVSGG